MASKLQNMEDTLTCPICAEVFRKPVTLPCQHNYCRECLQVFSDTPSEENGITTNADNTYTKTDDAPKQDDSSTNSSTAQPEQSVILCCPVCRQTTNLGIQGVAGLPTNFTLAEIVENFPAERRKEKRGPICSVCEDKTQLAVKACTTCCMIYCTDCFTSCHPEKGAFKRHHIISVDEYLSQKKAADLPNSEEKNEASDPPPTCDIHRQTLSIFCVTCQGLICPGCLNDHDEHSSSGIEKAFKKQEVPFLEKVKLCEKMKASVTDCVQEIQKLIADIKDQEECRVSEIQRAYDRALTTLQIWRDTALETVQQRHKRWLDQSDIMIKDLQLNLGKTESLVTTTKKLFSGKQVGFLQELKSVSARMDDQLSTMRDRVMAHEDLMKECNKFLQEDTAQFRHLILTEKIIKKPMLQFQMGGSSRTKIKEDGLVVEAESPRDYYRVYTDGNFQTGHYYWEFEVTVNLSDEPNSYLSCFVGVVHRRLHFGQAGIKTVWEMQVEYRDQNFKCLGDGSDVLPAYKSWNPYPGHHNLGVYLDCYNRSITFIDCSQTKVIWSQGGVDTSKVLAPIIGFRCINTDRFNNPAVSASARLITRDNASLQQIISDALRS